MATVRVRTTWKRSRLLAGGAIVLFGAVWTGPQMAAASAPPTEKPAQAKPGKRPTTTTSTTSTTRPPATTTTTVKPPATTTTTVKKPPGTTTTTVKPPTTTTTAPPKDKPGKDDLPAPSAGPPSGPGGGGGGGGSAGGDTVAPSAGGGGAPAPGGSPSHVGGGGGGASVGSPADSARGFIGPRAARRTGAPASAPSVAVPQVGGGGDNALPALQQSDGAAQATVRSISGGQSLPAQGGTALYAQLASAPDPLAVDSYPGNPYLVFVILTVFGIGVVFTGRRREEPARFVAVA